MSVIVQYIVERDGVRKMTFTSKREADAYDRMLDMADELFTLLGEGDFGVDEEKLEEIALHLAKNGARAGTILKGGKPKAPNGKKGSPHETEVARGAGDETAAEGGAEADGNGERATGESGDTEKLSRNGRRKAA